jgi:Flp pilus assembly protein TadG
MRSSHRSRRLRGATAVEFAVVAPVVMLVIFGQIIGGLGVARYQEVAHLARDCARYASTHGGLYQHEGIAGRTGVPAVSSSEQLRNYLAGRTVLLDPSQIQIDLSWSAPSSYSPRNMPTYMDTNPALIPPGQVVVQNRVIVKLTHQWAPAMLGIGPITLTSTSEMPMSY